MINEVTTTNADVDKVPAVKSNITAEMFASQRVAARMKAQKPDATPDKPELKDSLEPKEPHRETESKEPEELEEPKAEEVQDVHSKEIDLGTMSEAELRELADKLGSRAVARFGELTAKRKQAEERLAVLEAKLNEVQQPKIDPLITKKTEINPYANIKTLPDLQAKARELDEAIEWAEDVLWNNDHMAADDSVAVVDGNDVSKAQVRKVFRDAQKARKEHLPAQLAFLRAKEQRNALKGQMTAAAHKELLWLDGEDNDVRKQYEALRESPVLRQAVEAVPELEPYMEYMVAHAANSIYGRKEIRIDSKPSLSADPPYNPGSSSAGSERPESKTTKVIKDIQNRFKTTGDAKDFVALRTEQLSKRKSI